MRLLEQIVELFLLGIGQFFTDFLAGAQADILNGLAHVILAIGDDFLNVRTLSQSELQVLLQPVNDLPRLIDLVNDA